MMKIERLDHFTLRTRKLAETVAFYEQVIGLHVGPRPPFTFAGHWLYAGDQPVVHLAADNPDDPNLRAYLGPRDITDPGISGALDHIAFRCTGLRAYEARLRKRAVPYYARTVPDLMEHQLFVVDPNGLTVEFIFPASETASWVGQAEYPGAV